MKRDVWSRCGAGQHHLHAHAHAKSIRSPEALPAPAPERSPPQCSKSPRRAGERRDRQVLDSQHSLDGFTRFTAFTSDTTRTRNRNKQNPEPDFQMRTLGSPRHYKWDTDLLPWISLKNSIQDGAPGWSSRRSM